MRTPCTLSSQTPKTKKNIICKFPPPPYPIFKPPFIQPPDDIHTHKKELLTLIEWAIHNPFYLNLAQNKLWTPIWEQLLNTSWIINEISPHTEHSSFSSLQSHTGPDAPSTHPQRSAFNILAGFFCYKKSRDYHLISKLLSQLKLLTQEGKSDIFNSFVMQKNRQLPPHLRLIWRIVIQQTNSDPTWILSPLGIEFQRIHLDKSISWAEHGYSRGDFPCAVFLAKQMKTKIMGHGLLTPENLSPLLQLAQKTAALHWSPGYLLLAEIYSAIGHHIHTLLIQNRSYNQLIAVEQYAERQRFSLFRAPTLDLDEGQIPTLETSPDLFQLIALRDHAYQQMLIHSYTASLLEYECENAIHNAQLGQGSSYNLFKHTECKTYSDYVNHYRKKMDGHVSSRFKSGDCLTIAQNKVDMLLDTTSISPCTTQTNA